MTSRPHCDVTGTRHGLQTCLTVTRPFDPRLGLSRIHVLACLEYQHVVPAEIGERAVQRPSTSPTGLWCPRAHFMLKLRTARKGSSRSGPKDMSGRDGGEQYYFN
jgi:hypothetical protein